ncbi:MAG TPA: dTDP-glucose 4,6-dehydratase [Acidobacteriota bacterium]|nr:dTDP-glucose 4,6-dehydratase [Acidobacteriota bacterium]
MKLLITGGAGFIGSNFISHILKTTKFSVVNFDVLTYAGNPENLAEFDSTPRYSFVRGDISDSKAVEGVLSAGFDALLNFAAETHVDRSILNAADFIRTNVVGTQTLLDAARRHGIPRYVQISTDEVYGSLGASGRFTETSHLAPNSPYSASKAGADLLVRAACRTYDLPAIVTRCSNNYGPFQFPEKFVPLMILNALEGKKLPVYGDGLYVRDWIHVQDHCRALERVLLEGQPGEVYNIGGSDERRNLDVVRRILQLTERSDELIQHVQDRPGHDRRYAVDSSKIERSLGWKPRIPFEEGLKETIQWYRENETWVQRVRSGAYLKYYEEMYDNRDHTLSRL